MILTSLVLHELGLIHTDLKPENVLLVDDSYITRSMDARPGLDYKVLNNPEIRLIDFGSATFTHEYHASVVSTRHYRAPEVIMGNCLLLQHISITSQVHLTLRAFYATFCQDGTNL